MTSATRTGSVEVLFYGYLDNPPTAVQEFGYPFAIDGQEAFFSHFFSSF